MSKFKIGDKVRIRKDLVVGKKYRKDKFVSNMEKYKGKNAIIEHISIDGKYGLNIDDRYYNWTDEMLEPVKEEQTKFKVGDKVRIKKDLKAYKDYGSCCTVPEMMKYKGKIATIDRISLEEIFNLDIDENRWFWNDEMLEPVQKVVEYQNKKYDVAMIEKNYNSPFVGKDCLRLTLKEHKEEILDDKEKEYLRNVIKPFRNRIDNITKRKCIYYHPDSFYILIHFKSGHDMPFPIFYNKKMYSGMKDNEPYTLEQLGL